MSILISQLATSFIKFKDSNVKFLNVFIHSEYDYQSGPVLQNRPAEAVWAGGSGGRPGAGSPGRAHVREQCAGAVLEQPM